MTNQPRTKPKTNRAGNAAVSLPMDCCQTPLYALDPLLPYLDPAWIVWEPAAGKGNIVRGLNAAGYSGFATDIQTGRNFFDFVPFHWDVLITNPPYSIKYPWLDRCYTLGKPFALLLPIDTIGSQKAQRLFARYGVEIIYMDKRVNFDMPNTGYSGSAQFSTAWFTWQLGIGKENTYTTLTRCADSDWIPPMLGGKR